MVGPSEGLPWSDSDLIRPLRNAEPEFLELLLTRFELKRYGTGAKLSVRFDDDTAAIWRREAKNSVLDRIPDFEAKAAEYQERLDGILLRSDPEPFVFGDDQFPFRYLSGGTLPVLGFLGSDDREYYVLIYREVFPIGWNIANGGSDSRAELRNPFDIVERELREELVMFDRAMEKLYVFESVSGKPEIRPEYLAARKLWERRPELFGVRSFGSLDEELVPTKWLGGPDVLEIHESSRPPVVVENCFLNVNAEDFGIEVDRPARLSIDQDAVLYDGEILGEEPVNSVVGLFEVGRMHDALEEGRAEFVPDFFYYGGRRYEDVDDLEELLSTDFIERMDGIQEKWSRDQWDRADGKLELCPVTRRIIRRCRPLWTPAARPESAYDIFVSFSQEDARLAGQVCQYLRTHTGRRVFWSEDLDNADFSDAIYDALGTARCLISVASNPRHLEKGWPKYEHRAFHIALCNQRKPPGAQLLSYISGFPPHRLPQPLQAYQALRHDPGNTTHSLERLLPFVRRAIGD